MSTDVKNIMLVGVGGQGTLLASKLLGQILLNGGYDVKVSEIHGMSQRGGSVATYVKYGKSVSSPVIEQGEADIIIAFEPLEAARYLPNLKKGGLLILNEIQIDPMPVITGAAKYPEAIVEKLKAQEIKVINLDALAVAAEAGGAKAVNVVLMGILARHMEFTPAEWERVITDTVPEKFRDMNIMAFKAGYAVGN